MSADKTFPEGWRMVRFGDVVSNVNENTRDPRSLGLDRVVGLDHLDPESLPLRRWDLLDEMPDGTSFTRTFKAGQVLFGKRRAYQRKVAVPDFSGICSGDILVFESSTEVLLQAFLPYIVQSAGFFDHALGTSAGSLSPRTKWQELAKYEFALPPIDEQERIVEVLQATSASTERLENVCAMAWGLMEAVGGAFVPRRQEDASGVLSDLCEVQVGFAFPSNEYSPTGVRLLRCSNVGVRSTNWDPGATKYWPQERREEFHEYELGERDVVIAMDRPFVGEGFKIARITREDLPALLLQRVGRLVPKAGVSSDDLWAVITSPAVRSHLERKQKGTDLPHISKFDIEAVPITRGSLNDPNLVAQFREAEKVMALSAANYEKTKRLESALIQVLLNVR